MTDLLTTLSPREREVAEAYSGGESYRQIAERLGIAPATVRTHIDTIYRKLGVSSKIALRRVFEASATPAEASGSDLASDPSNHLFPKSRTLRLLVLSATVLLAFGLSIALIAGRPNEAVPSADASLALTATSAPSIAVLPFLYEGTDPQHRQFVEWLTRDTAVDLAKFSTFFVYSTDTSFRYAEQGISPQGIGERLNARYLLSGEARWLGDDVQINVQVVDAETSRIVWSERFERPSDDLLELQADVVGTIAAQIGALEVAGGRLRQNELNRIARAQTGSLEAYAHYLRGWVFYERFDPEGNRLAQAEFNRAVTLDPAYSKAFAMIAWTHIQSALRGDAALWKTELAAAEVRAHEAVAADALEPFAHWAMGAVRLFQGQHDQSLAAFKRAVSLNPSNAEMLIYLGWAMVYAGQPKEALEYMESAVARNPAHPGWYYWDLAFAHFMARDYAEAARVLEQRSPRTPGTNQLLALIYARLGQSEDAAVARDRVLAILPNTTIEQAVRTEPFAEASDLQHFLDAMRQAGFPE